MTLRDLLKKKDKGEPPSEPGTSSSTPAPEPPVFTFMRSDTHTQEIISPPTFSSTESEPQQHLNDGSADETRSRLGRFRGKSHSRSASGSSTHTSGEKKRKSRERSPNPKRLSQRLHLKRSDPSSSHVPQDLPDIVGDGKEVVESQWEHRATILARENERQRSRPGTPTGSAVAELTALSSGLILGGRDGERESSPGQVVATKYVDDNIQEAIRLHEAGDLATSTQMFGRLADPHGENNALSQVLYGLALRHGWGCTPNPTEAVTYLSAAASNAASIEDLALEAGMKKGGAAKGELVLAIFELANCFRHGCGIKQDPVAALKVRPSTSMMKALDRGKA